MIVDHVRAEDHARTERAAVPVRCDIPGTVLSVEVGVGHPVAAGAEIAVLESMKMEIPVLSPACGVVVALCAVAGESVRAGHVMALVAAAPEEMARRERR